MYSFAGGGLPPHIRTMAIATFDNQTTSPDLPKELYDQMHEELQRGLGVRDAPRERADALVHGVIVSYDADVPVSFSANPQQAVTARRRLQVTIEVEIIDQSNGQRALPEQGAARRGGLRRARRSGRSRSRRSRSSFRRSSRECKAIGELAAAARARSDACSGSSSLAAIVYFGVNVGRVYWRFYQYQDDMRQEVRFARQRTNDQILAHLRASADSLGLPEEAAKISIRRTDKSIAIESDYYETRRSADVRARDSLPSARRRPALSVTPRSARQNHELGTRACVARDGARAGRLHERRVRSPASRSRRRPARCAPAMATRSSSASTATNRFDDSRVPSGPFAARRSAATCSRRSRWSTPSSSSTRTRRFELITALRPDVLVKGGDYTEASIVGASEVRELGRRRRRHSAHAGAFHHIHHRATPWPLKPFRRALDARDDEMRPVILERAVAPYAEGSCLVSFGATRVLCTASVEEGVPGWRRGRGEGWLTAEYAMLPRATQDAHVARTRRRLGGRTQEIQRLIGRSIRAMLDDFRLANTRSSSTATCSSRTAARARRRSPARASRRSTRSTGSSRQGGLRVRR